MEHCTQDKPIAEPVAQPAKVTGRPRWGRRIGLDLESDDPAVGRFQEQVDFLATVGLAHMEHPGRLVTHRQLGSEL